MQSPIWIDQLIDPKALLVTAHPDDETIFAGGLILTSPPGTKWTIMCVTEEEERRCKEFYCACDYYEKNSRNSIIPIYLGIIPESEASLGQKQTQQLNKNLKNFGSNFDIIFTHNKEGEYGNEHHRAVNRSVLEVIANPNTWFFISPGSSNVCPDNLRSKIPNENKIVELDPTTLELKRTAFYECHKSEVEKYVIDWVNGKFSGDLRETLEWEFYKGKEEFTCKR